MKGKLYVKFSVTFPERLNTDQIKAIEGVLPQKLTPELSKAALEECEETTLHDVNIKEEMKRKQRYSREAYDEDDGDDEDMHGHGGAQRVQCAQQ